MQFFFFPCCYLHSPYTFLHVARGVSVAHVCANIYIHMCIPHVFLLVPSRSSLESPFPIRSAHAAKYALTEIMGLPLGFIAGAVPLAPAVEENRTKGLKCSRARE